jgi:hypothetical protein
MIKIGEQIATKSIPIQILTVWKILDDGRLVCGRKSCCNHLYLKPDEVYTLEEFMKLKEEKNV